MRSNRNPSNNPGFALVATMLMGVLLSILALGLLSVSTITLRTADRSSGIAEARANARMALLIAIGHLQKTAGPDQRVTGTSELAASSPTNNPQWTGVWETGEGNDHSAPTWLVSGDNPDPAALLDEENSSLLASVPSSDPTRMELRAPLVPLTGSKHDGRYAYWVGDEGTKARVDIGIPSASTTSERYVRSQTPSVPGLAGFDSENRTAWADFDPGSQNFIDSSSLVSMDTVSLASADGGAFAKRELARHYFEDLTTGGFGLPVNVRDGGMKTDLSILFDKSLEKTTDMVSRHIGAVPASISQGSAVTYDFMSRITDRSKFFLSPTISENHTRSLGPNWGSLWSYARSWENVTNNTSPLIGPWPRPSSDLRQANWIPYNSDRTYSASYADDYQHANSALHPVVSMVQLSFRITSGGAQTGTTTSPPAGTYYVPRLEVKPVIGIWNPYNVALTANDYTIDWAIAPYLRLSHSNNGGTPDVTEIWLREYWKSGTGTNGVYTLPTEDSQGGGFFKLLAENVTFAPGEIKYFSINQQEPLAGSYLPNKLVQTWGEAGGFHMDIKRSTDHADGVQKKGSPLKVPSGNDIWFDNLDLQDTHMDDPDVIGWPQAVGTTAHFSGKISSTASSCWISMKSGDLHLNRYTNLWNGGNNDEMGLPASSAYFMPEPVSGTNPNTTRTYKIDNLGAGDVGHLASWRFMTRNATEAQKSTSQSNANQGIRGWIDSNPRPMASSVRFDGSRVMPGKSEGLNMVSNFIAGSNGYPDLIGDCKGGSRGLIAEGHLGEIEPDASLSSAGYRGYGGAASTRNGGGSSNVILYDIPRVPLTSVGQFQHAELSRYNFEPGFVVGNSYANLRIPPGETKVENFAGVTDKNGKGMVLTDISYEVNESLWDSVFFSTLSPDYVGKSGQDFDLAFDYASLVSGDTRLPNPRMVFTPQDGDTSIDTIIDDAGALAPEAIASRILIKGAFNVNSTSVKAWKAILSSMASSELPVVDLVSTNPATSFSDTSGVRFNRLNFSGSAEPFESDSTDPGGEFWHGWRKLTDAEFETLAVEIVKQIKARGPFRSMADFVNRNPEGTTEQQLKGTLQTALDIATNQNLAPELGATAVKPDGSHFAGEISNEKQSAGYAGNILQGDVLQSLAPILQVRSDYFRIRTYGDALDKSGKVIARAWCEAFVQRHPEYVDGSDSPETAFNDLSETNLRFGRKFHIVSFRWLSPSEI